MRRSFPRLRRVAAASLRGAVIVTLICGRGGSGASPLRGDWDYYRMLGAKPSGGFDALRRFGFAHFENADTTGAWINRRNGARMERIHSIVATGDSLVIDLAAGTSIRARISKDTIAGQYYVGKDPTQRVWFVRRNSPPEYEPFYALWPGPVSDSGHTFTIDPAVPMKARDGTVLMNFVATPSGPGPFGVVMERTPYLRIDTAAATFWASRGFIYVKQDVRGRGGSGGVLDMNAMQESDGYDAVEWAAKLPGANGKVGMIGRVRTPGSTPGTPRSRRRRTSRRSRPAVATADPLRIVPYIDMVFSPTIVPWLCLTQVRETMSDMSNLDVETAFNSLPVIASAEKAGCGRPKYWTDWFDHQKLDSYWRSLSIEARLNRVKVPVLGIGGWYDDARGTIRNYMGIDTLKRKPFQRIVMDAGAHKGIDYVNGSFGAEARIDSRMLQLRWFDHYLKGVDNGVDREPPVDIFIPGDNKWRKEKEFPLARTKWTDFYIHSGGKANGGAGDGTLDTVPPKAEPADTFTYDPGKPTPYLIDARELELSLNEDYSKVHATRNDLLAFTTAPFEKATEITGPMSATLYAATDALDTDWNVMLLDVYPDGRVMRIQDGVARAIPRGIRQAEAAHAGHGLSIRHRPVVYGDRHSSGASAARDRGVGGVPEVRPESQYRRGQRAGDEVRERAAAGVARQRACVAGEVAGDSAVVRLSQPRTQT